MYRSTAYDKKLFLADLLLCCRRDMIDGKHVGGTDDPFEFQLGRGESDEGVAGEFQEFN